MSAVPALTLPTGALTLLVPAAMVAEVVPRPLDLEPASSTTPGILGAFRWRNNPVTLVSFERLAGGAEAREYRRVCVLHPLPGRGPSEYCGLAVSGEPRSLEVPDSAETGSVPAQISGQFAAGALIINDHTFVIPDFDALSGVLYPGR